jgi:ergothioneine biosynthesis protein EgtB
VLAPFAIADRLVTNAEYAEFIRDGGYRRVELWLADAWETLNRERWSRPLYWSRALDAELTLSGLVPLDRAAPVVHVSYYEADAFARWVGARLPTEAEWEVVAREMAVEGNLLESGELHPVPAQGPNTSPRQIYGDTWEWTASPYAGYPGYRPSRDALGESESQHMSHRWVLRGGSCVTPAAHIRATYRNFLYPQARWQFSGVRLARTI